MNQDNAPWYTRYTENNYDEESGRGEIDLEDFELEKICSEVLRMVRLTTYAVRMEHEEVIINRDKKKQAAAGNGGATMNRLEYLAAKHLTEDKSNASSAFKILWAGTPESAGVGNKFNALVAVKVQRKTSEQRFWWMLSADNPNLDILLDEISEDTEKWVNRELLIHLEKQMPSEILFVRSEVLPVATKAAVGK